MTQHLWNFSKPWSDSIIQTVPDTLQKQKTKNKQGKKSRYYRKQVEINGGSCLPFSPNNDDMWKWKAKATIAFIETKVVCKTFGVLQNNAINSLLLGSHTIATILRYLFWLSLQGRNRSHEKGHVWFEQSSSNLLSSSIFSGVCKQIKKSGLWTLRSAFKSHLFYIAYELRAIK